MRNGLRNPVMQQGLRKHVMKDYNIRDMASHRSLACTFAPSYVMSRITSSYGPSCEPHILHVIKIIVNEENLVLVF
jgi:hypothetical protein